MSEAVLLALSGVVLTRVSLDLSDLLRSVGDLDTPLRHGNGDGPTHPGARDPRDGPGASPGGRPIRDIYVPDRLAGSGIKVPTRDFR